MTSRKLLFLLWGAVYWPFLLVGGMFMLLAEVFCGIGCWLHDLLIDFAYPLMGPKPSPREVLGGRR